MVGMFGVASWGVKVIERSRLYEGCVSYVSNFDAKRKPPDQMTWWFMGWADRGSNPGPTD